MKRKLSLEKLSNDSKVNLAKEFGLDAEIIEAKDFVVLADTYVISHTLFNKVLLVLNEAKEEHKGTIEFFGNEETLYRSLRKVNIAGEMNT